jgi:hypothetical protein
MVDRKVAPLIVRDVRWHEGMKSRAASRQVEFEQGWERADNRTKREKAREARERVPLRSAPILSLQRSNASKSN